MAQFIAFDKNTEVVGLGLLSCIAAFPEHARPHIEQLMAENNLTNITPDKWFKAQDWLNAFKAFSTSYGSNTLFHIGVAVFEGFIFPPNVSDLESALKLIAQAYREHHRNGRIGYIELRSFDAKAKKAVMEYCNPYPCNFERGIVTACVRKYKPQDDHFVDVQLDKDKPSRLDGAESSFYIITWG
ncbi:MAG: hypothetical protein PHU06_14800 [Gallionella sp.]|nr:hypothetical protein [Gallionella sp.]